MVKIRKIAVIGECMIELRPNLAEAGYTRSTIDAQIAYGGDTLNVVLNCHGEDDPRPAVYAAVKATDWVMVEFVQQTKNLETIFRELTKES